MHSFLSVDPMLYKLPQAYLLDPQQMNSYAYARNNPIVYTDPTGEFAFIPFIIGAAAIINFFVQSTDVAKAPGNQTQAQGTSQIDLNLNRVKAASNYATVAITFGAGAVGIASSLKSVSTKTTTSSIGQGAKNSSTPNSAVFNQGKVAQDIANGHGYTNRANELKSFGVNSRNEYKNLVESTMKNPSQTRSLDNGRTAYLNEERGFVVVHDPLTGLKGKDPGTAFFPINPKTKMPDPLGYFNDILQ